MVRIRNITKTIQAVPGFAAFTPGEIREVSKDEADILVLNPYLTEDRKGDAESSKKAESVKEAKTKE